MDQRRKSPNQLHPRVQAASWFLKIQDGLSQSGFRKWRLWLAEEDAHARAFDKVNQFWQDADHIEDLPWPGDEELASDTYDGSAELVPLREPVSRSGPGRGHRRLWLSVAASVVAIGVLVLYLAQGFQETTGNFGTATAEHRTISLDDGSVITLGAASEVEYVYSRDVRRVELKNGEAYFKVAPDAERPFTVAAGTRTVRALGTEFEINIGVRDIRVSVLEGRVRIEGPSVVSAGTPREAASRLISNLSGGDVLDFNKAEGAGVISEVDPLLTSSWMDGRLAYVSTSLESVIADVNRYSETELIIGDEATRQLIFTGTIFSDDVDNWLAGLESVFPLRLVPVKGHGILLIQSNS